jgi:hypothetical protein
MSAAENPGVGYGRYGDEKLLKRLRCILQKLGLVEGS